MNLVAKNGKFEMKKQTHLLSELTGCGFPCSSKKCTENLRAKIRNEETGKEHALSKTECAFQHFLEKNGLVLGSDFTRQEAIEDCPFVKKDHEHKADFYFPKIKLYVEVKGEMTFYEVNVLHWLLKYSGKKIYVLQVTCEDWMGDFYELKKERESRLENLTAPKRIEEVTKEQYEEILSYIRNGLTDDVNKKMVERLHDYLTVRRRDMFRWNEMAKQVGVKV